MSRMWVLPSWAKPQKLIRYCGEFSVNFLFFKMLWASVIMRHVESEKAWPLQRNHHVDLSHTGSNEVVMKVSKHWSVLLLCLTRTCGFGYRHETLVVFLFFIRFWLWRRFIDVQAEGRTCHAQEVSPCAAGVWRKPGFRDARPRRFQLVHGGSLHPDQPADVVRERDAGERLPESRGVGLHTPRYGSQLLQTQNMFNMPKKNSAAFCWTQSGWF